MIRVLSFLGTMLFLTLSTGLSAQDALTLEENKLLGLALEKNFAGNGFTVVNPDVNPARFFREAGEARDRLKQELHEKPALKGLDTDALMDKFFERNRKPVKLDLASNAGNGYIVDYDGKFAAYFASGPGGNGWKTLRKENPQAHGMTGASVPVFDAASGLAALYLGTQYDWLAGGGYLIVFRYEKDKLIELARIMLWIS